MMLSGVLNEKNIFPELRAREKPGLLKEMIGLVAASVRSLDAAAALDAIMEREQSATTGVGHGVALPHCKLKGLNEIVVAFGRSASGVDYGSTDGLPVHLVFMIMGPQNSSNARLKILAVISGLLKNPEVRSSLLRARAREEILAVIVAAEKKV